MQEVNADNIRPVSYTHLDVYKRQVMYGAVDFYRACKAEGIHPIIGCEVYVARRTRFDKQHEFDAESRHLVLLCKNETGYRNLSYMVSQAFSEGFYIKPRIDVYKRQEGYYAAALIDQCGLKGLTVGGAQEMCIRDSFSSAATGWWPTMR